MAPDSLGVHVARLLSTSLVMCDTINEVLTMDTETQLITPNLLIAIIVIFLDHQVYTKNIHSPSHKKSFNYRLCFTNSRAVEERERGRERERER